MSEKILIVDDDPVIVRLIETILQEYGYDTVTAFDGIDAMLQIERERPDLVVLDIVMPEINGYDICCELRFDNKHGKIPIIILTETEREIDEKVGARVNIEYLHKPLNPKLLLDKIELLLNKP